MPRGGKRSGTAGKAYPQRHDLTPTAAPGQTYGQAGQQLASQAAMPIAAQGPPSGAPQGPPQTPPAVLPGSLGPLDAPSNRPDEPLTEGSPMGPGASSMNFPTPLNPLMAGLVFLNQIPNLPANLAAVRDQLRVQQR